MFAVLLISFAFKAGTLVLSHAAAVAAGYAFRGKIHKEIGQAGKVVESVAASAASAASDVSKKV